MSLFTRKDTKQDRICLACNQRIPDHNSECEHCKNRQRKAVQTRIETRIARGYSATDRVLWIFDSSK